MYIVIYIKSYANNYALLKETRTFVSPQINVINTLCGRFKTQDLSTCAPRELILFWCEPYRDQTNQTNVNWHY